MGLYVYPEVGRTGLCNMLITWSRALVFAHEHQAKMIAPGWVNVWRLGPWLRHEKDKRFYIGQFTNRGYASGWRRWLHLHCNRRIPERAYRSERKGVVVFTGHEEGLRIVQDHCDLIRAELYRIASPQIVQALRTLPRKFIGVHLRMGDFSRIGFSLKAEYYIRAIDIALSRVGRNTPVLVFSDARPSQLTYLVERFESLKIMPPAPALQDVLSLSMSRLLVATNRSTFSAWAAVLGGIPSLWDKDGEPPNTFLGLRKFELV